MKRKYTPLSSNASPPSSGSVPLSKPLSPVSSSSNSGSSPSSCCVLPIVSASSSSSGPSYVPTDAWSCVLSAMWCSSSSKEKEWGKEICHQNINRAASYDTHPSPALEHIASHDLTLCSEKVLKWVMLALLGLTALYTYHLSRPNVFGLTSDTGRKMSPAVEWVGVAAQ